MATITMTDPVCGMVVDPTSASRTSDYQGQTYYFCSPACKKAFEADPQRYLAPKDPGVSCSCCVVGQ